MTKRFCGMDSYPIEFPLNHPKTILLDPLFEKKIGEIILYPLRMRIKIRIARIMRKILRVPVGKSIKQYVKNGEK